MKNLFLIGVSLLLFTCCHKHDPEPELPPITTTGANTFGCKVNGKIWLPSARPKGPLPQIEGGIKTRYDSVGPEKNWYDLLIFADKNDNTGLSLYLSRINSTGIYGLNMDTYQWPESPQPEHSYACFFRQRTTFITSYYNHGEVNLLRYDTLNRIFSGTFYFRVLRGGDTITVTDGRFDIDQKKIN